MRGANVVRRRSVTNLGETAGETGSVNGGQADGGGSGLLAGGSAAGDGSGAAARRDTDPKRPAGPQAAVGATAAQGVQGGALAPQGAPAPPGTVRPVPARPQRAAQAQSRFALTNWRVRWRLVAVIAVPTLTAAFLGAFTIYGDVGSWQANGRVQHLAQLDAAVVHLTQALEDERDYSAAYAADRTPGGNLPAPLKAARDATDSAAQAVASQANGVGTAAGYHPGPAQALNPLTASTTHLPAI